MVSLAYASAQDGHGTDHGTPAPAGTAHGTPAAGTTHGTATVEKAGGAATAAASGGHGAAVNEHGAGCHGDHCDKTRGGIFVMFCLAVGVVCQVLLKHLMLPYTVVLLIVGLCVGFWEKYAEHTEGLSILGNSMQVWATIDPHVFLFIFLPALLYEVGLFNQTIIDTWPQ